MTGFGSLLERLRQKRSRALPSAILPRQRDPEGTWLSFAQQRLWFISRLDPDNSAYNVASVIRIAGPLNVTALGGALGEITRRHEVLRTHFIERSGEPLQVVDPPGAFHLAVADLSALASPGEEWRRLAEAEVGHPFNLERGPLVRATLLRLGSDLHVLLLTVHHLASDGWSVGILIGEILVLYAAAAEKRPARLPPLPVQYADFALWQREWLSSEVLEKHLGFWRRQLAGSPPVLALPTDRPRPKMRSPRGAQHPIALPSPLVESLERLARAEGTTLFVLLLAAFQALLHRWTAQSDIVVGAPFANRKRSEIQGLIGFFVNTLALRTRLGERPSFREVLQRARETALGAYAHQELPFERLVLELQPERTTSHAPLFQVVFAFQNTPEPPLALPGLDLAVLRVDSGTSMFDLTLDLKPGPEGIHGWIEHSTDLFYPATIARLAGHFIHLLAAVGEQADQPVWAIPLLSPAERHQLLLEWNDTASARPAATVHRLFAEQAALTPEAIALDGGGERLTYQELEHRANRLAWHLRSLGVGPDVPAALFVDRSVPAIVAMLAVLKAGGAYAPLDPAYPPERLGWLLASLGSPVLVASRSGPRPPRADVHTVFLDDMAAAAGSDEAPPDLAVGDSLAYVLHTSGSTGMPKAVAVTHAGIIRLVRGVRYAELGPGEVFLQLAPLSFDAATFEIWGPLLNGGRLAVFPPGAPALEELAAFIREREITTLWLTAGLFHQLVDGPGIPPGVRRLLAGGDVLSPSHVQAALASSPGLVLVNGYGPTEATTFTCCHPLRDPAAAGAGIPIGRPISNTRVYAVDAERQPVPLGAAGELLIGGPGLARGYRGRPDLTAERYVPDPFGPPGERLYCSGDLVRLLPDGRIEFSGRIDRQVKIRGFRIEPGEIEAALTRHPLIAQAVVVPREDVRGDKRLAAYVVPRAPDRAPAAADLRRFLGDRLPGHMIPAAFVVLDELPLNANGKVETAALPAPERPRNGAASALWADPAEELLCVLWQGVLGGGEVGATDNFFELGGHSLLATRLVSRIRDAFGVELPLADLFAHPTAAGVAAQLAAARRGAGRRPPPPVTAVPRSGPLPLSFAQERLWFFGQVEPQSPLFNMPLGVRLRGPLDAAALAASLAAVADRHEALRTTFQTVAGQPCARVSATAAALPLVDLAGLGEAARAAGERLTHEESRRPFDLAAGPLLRPLLLRIDPGEHVLLATMHHIVSDGWSIEVLVRELAAFYTAFSRGEDPGLPELPLQYADYAAWQRGWMTGGVLAAQVAYWREQLRGAPTVLEVPTDRPRPARQTFRGAVRPLALDEGLTRRLAELSHAAGCTLYMTLLAAFEVLLHAWTGRRDLLLGSPVAGRNRGETEGLIGFFVNMLVLRASCGDNPTFRELLARVRTTTLGAYAHQDLAFDKLVQELKPARDPSRMPIFQVVLAYQEDPGWHLALPGLAAEILDPPEVVARYDLHLSVFRRQGRLGAYLTYAADLYDEATAAALLDRFAALLAAVCDEPEIRVDRLKALSRPQRRELMEPKSLKEQQREKLFSVKRPKAVTAAKPLVSIRHLASGRALPLVIEPEAADVDLASWAAAHRELLEEHLQREGAILFRGFDVGSVAQFREVATAISPSLIGYEDPSTPRTEIQEKVYTSTEYPNDQYIPLHNELSYNYVWPLKIFFYCVTPPGDGGATPLADSRRLFERIDPAVRERFASRRVMYVRNFGEGLGLPWQKVFQTTEREGVEAYCREHGMTWEWRGGDRLRTRQIRPAIARHPRTGETVWFNQANVHHPSSLPPALRESLLAVAEDRETPLDMNACYGDGTLIRDDEIEAVHRAYREETVTFPWQQKDILLADNMLVAHGREPFSGPRKIAVLMSESTSEHNL